MLVDYFVDFKGCNPIMHHHHHDENSISIFEFIKLREEIFEQVPTFAEPDFAQDSRLPDEARNYKNEDMEDEWEKCLKHSLDHMTTREWDCYSSSIRELFTGSKERRHLASGKSDVMFARDRGKRDMAWGHVTIDIDSILAMFKDLSVIKTVIRISIISNPSRNLKRSVHLVHQGAPLHHMPHFHLGHFGHDPKFELYVMLLILYDKTIKQERGNLHNHVLEDIRAAFMNLCFLPAAEEVIGYNDSQAWDFKYDVSKAKMMAAAREGKVYPMKLDAFHKDIYVDLDAKYINSVWRNCEWRLKTEMRRGGKLRRFQGLQFLLTLRDISIE
jgi:hypothetical protein